MAKFIMSLAEKAERDIAYGHATPQQIVADLIAEGHTEHEAHEAVSAALAHYSAPREEQGDGHDEASHDWEEYADDTELPF